MFNRLVKRRRNRLRIKELATVFGVFAAIGLIVTSFAILYGDNVNVGECSHNPVLAIAKGPIDATLLLITLIFWLVLSILYIWTRKIDTVVKMVGSQLESTIFLFLGAAFGSIVFISIYRWDIEPVIKIVVMLILFSGGSILIRKEIVQLHRAENRTLRVVCTIVFVAMIFFAVSALKNAVNWV